MKIICMIAAIVFPVMCAAEDSAKSDLPMAVRSVTTQRVGKSLIRVIEYNTEIDPKFSVELIKPPKMELLQKLNVKAIQIDVDGSRKLLNFNDTSGVFITGAAIDKGKGAVNFDVEFFGAGHAGGYYRSSCAIVLSDNHLSGPECRLVSTEEKK